MGVKRGHGREKVYKHRSVSWQAASGQNPEPVVLLEVLEVGVVVRDDR